LNKYHERRCEPAFIPFVAATAAQFKGISGIVVAEEITLNSKDFL